MLNKAQTDFELLEKTHVQDSSSSASAGLMNDADP
jgi:hypothetical protein